MATPKLSPVSPVRRDDKPCAAPSAVLRVPDASAAEAYEQYLRLPELSALWKPGSFPEWAGEGLVKPALQALEITFRFASLALSDPRGYASRRELARRLELLAAREAELVAALCEGDDRSAPLAELTASGGVLPRERSGSEVWQLPGSAAAVVCRASEASLLPRLAAWDKSETLASRIMYAVEAQMQGCAFTLGLGEPNLAGKPVLEYDRVVRPHDLHALKPKPTKPGGGYRNRENVTLFTMYQILECWLCAASRLLARLNDRIEAKSWEAAASDCWILERVWKLLADVEDLHMLMDPDDFLRLKSQLAIRAAPGSDASFCFRSRALLHVANATRDLKKRVPWVLGVEVDPKGGPRVQEAAMRLYHSRRRGEGEEAGKVELLQAFQAVEAAVKRFFFAYRQLVAAVMGTAEASGNRALFVPAEGMDPLAQMFLEPPYYPSLDAAKTFLADYWVQQMAGASASPSRQS